MVCAYVRLNMACFLLSNVLYVILGCHIAIAIIVNVRMYQSPAITVTRAKNRKIIQPTAVRFYAEVRWGAIPAQSPCMMAGMENNSPDF